VNLIEAGHQFPSSAVISSLFANGVYHFMLL